MPYAVPPLPPVMVNVPLLEFWIVPATPSPDARASMTVDSLPCIVTSAESFMVIRTFDSGCMSMRDVVYTPFRKTTFAPSSRDRLPVSPDDSPSWNSENLYGRPKISVPSRTVPVFPSPRYEPFNGASPNRTSVLPSSTEKFPAEPQKPTSSRLAKFSALSNRSTGFSPTEKRLEVVWNPSPASAHCVSAPNTR